MGSWDLFLSPFVKISWMGRRRGGGGGFLFCLGGLEGSGGGRGVGGFGSSHFMRVESFETVKT